MAAAEVFVPNLLVAMLLNGLVQSLQIGAYAARYAGVKTGRIATAISLFNLVMTASRLATLIVTPALGGLADATANDAIRNHLTVAPEHLVDVFALQLRLVVFAGTIGTTIGLMLMPTFIFLFVRGIGSFERQGSVLRAVLRLCDIAVLREVAGSLRFPDVSIARTFSIAHVPRKLLIANVVVTAVYSIGVLASYYASVLNLAARTTAVGLSGIINGIGTIAFTLLVDPTSAIITDQAVKGERTLDEVRSLIFYLAVTAIVGTLLSQLLLWPGAWLIAQAAHIFVSSHHL
ncbi:MAG TPA: DUF2837 family protein [Candidatus Lustribacter sp.]|nr:DUF2837 family protein [Candidatus Lustribacter sp.]